jgi:hypothetical protein
VIMSRHPNSGQNQNIRIANESFEKVAKFKYLGTTSTNHNDIRDEIKSRLNSGNAWSCTSTPSYFFMALCLVKLTMYPTPHTSYYLLVNSAKSFLSYSDIRKNLLQKVPLATTTLSVCKIAID